MDFTEAARTLTLVLCVLGGTSCESSEDAASNDAASKSDTQSQAMDAGVDASLDGSSVQRGDASTDARIGNDASSGNDAGTNQISLPTPNAKFDYQLGEAYPPPSGVSLVVRDRSAAPAAGIYNICYVNGFQTQPDERDFWEEQHPDLLLRDGGEVVIDPDWNEIILDVTTEAKRVSLAGIVGGWIDGCGASGFDAVEIDNLDTYSRTDGLVSQNDAVEFMKLLSERAHNAGLAIAQKNSAEILRKSEMKTDFVVAEECNRWDECGDFTAAYGDLVFVIEYRQRDFDKGCRDFAELSIRLRDLNLVGPGAGAYVYDHC